MSFHKVVYFFGEVIVLGAGIYFNYRVLKYVASFLQKRGLEPSSGGKAKERKRLALIFLALVFTFWLVGPIYKYQLFVERDEDGDLSGFPIAMLFIIPLTWAIYTPAALRLRLYDKKREEEDNE